MSKLTLQKKLTAKEVFEKAEELSKTHNVKIIPLMYEPSEEAGAQCIGYLRQPTFQERAYSFEETIKGNSIDGAEAVLIKCLLKEESDARILDDEEYRYSAVMDCVKFIKGYENKLKKK